MIILSNPLADTLRRLDSRGCVVEASVVTVSQVCFPVPEETMLSRELMSQCLLESKPSPELCDAFMDYRNPTPTARHSSSSRAQTAGSPRPYEEKALHRQACRTIPIDARTIDQGAETVLAAQSLCQRPLQKRVGSDS